MTWKEIGAVCLLSIVVLLAPPVSGASLSDLKSTISSFDDPHMDADDLAFYLMTHDFDARPMGGYVQVEVSERICKLTPNGPAPGLCTISVC
jgi:hypothetical protein